MPGVCSSFHSLLKSSKPDIKRCLLLPESGDLLLLLLYSVDEHWDQIVVVHPEGRARVRSLFDHFRHERLNFLRDQTKMRAPITAVLPLKGHGPQMHNLIKPVSEVCNPMLETCV